MGLSRILWLAAVPTAGVSGLFFALAFPKPKRSEGVPLRDVLRFARNPLVLLFGFLLFFQSGNEFIVGGYTSTYLARDIGLPLNTASYLLAAYWASIMVARVALSRLLLKAKGPGVVMLSGLGTAAGVGLLMLAHSTPLAAAGTVLIGLSFASIYPTVLGLAGAEFEEASGSVFGILFAIALCGGMAMPWAVGQFAARTSLRQSLVCAAVGGLAICGIQALIAGLLLTSSKNARAA